MALDVQGVYAYDPLNNRRYAYTPCKTKPMKAIAFVDEPQCVPDKECEDSFSRIQCAAACESR